MHHLEQLSCALGYSWASAEEEVAVDDSHATVLYGGHLDESLPVGARVAILGVRAHDDHLGSALDDSLQRERWKPRTALVHDVRSAGRGEQLACEGAGADREERL